MRMVYARGHRHTRNIPVPRPARQRFCIDDAEVLKLADDAIRIEDHYSAHAGHPMPMDIEWAKDADDGQLYVIQARPETVASRRTPTALESYSLKGAGPVLATGRAVGEKIAVGPTGVIADARELGKFRPGEVLVTDSTIPDWEPIMKIAAAIVTEGGGRTCHAAIVARELGVPAVVGAAGAKDALRTGRGVTVSCAEGDVGRVYDGALAFETTRIETADLERPRTAIMLNLGNPELAFSSSHAAQRRSRPGADGVHRQRAYRCSPACQLSGYRSLPCRARHRFDQRQPFKHLPNDAGGP
jgi:pyruvate,water dikinase